MNEIEDERLRQAAAGWFGRMRGPQADEHRDAFEAWRADPAHAAAYDRMLRRWDESAILGDSRLSGLRVTRSAPRRATPPIILIGAIAAAVAALIAGAAWVTLERSDLTSRDARAYASAVGEIRAVGLAGGQTLTLDTDSQVRRVRIDGAQALRLDRGRARVQAGPDPVRVDLDGAVLAVQDGAIDLTRVDGGYDLTAVSVAVEVRPRRPAGAAKSVRLSPGQHLMFVGGRITGPSPDRAGSREWPQGLASFDGARLSEVIAQASRYGGPRIRLADPALGALQVTGAFKITQAAPLAQALAAAFKLEITTAANGDLILSRTTT